MPIMTLKKRKRGKRKPSKIKKGKKKRSKFLAKGPSPIVEAMTGVQY